MIVADVQTAIIAVQDVVGVPRIDPDGVHVHVTRVAVTACGIQRGKRPSAIERLGDGQTRHVHRIRVLWIDTHLAEIHRARIAVADVPPRAAAVVRSEDAAGRGIERRRGLRLLRRGGTATSTAETTTGSRVVAPVKATTTTTTTTTTTPSGFGINFQPNHTGFDLHVNDSGIRTRNVEADSAIRSRRQSIAGQPCP